MRLSTLFKKLVPGRKTHQIKHELAYSILEYISADGSVSEKIWNGTNLIPPEYIVDKSKNFKLFLKEDSAIPMTVYTPTPGERYFIYKTPQTYIQEKTPMLQLYWRWNLEECQKRYSSYEEFFAIACRSMDKPRLELREA